MILAPIVSTCLGFLLALSARASPFELASLESRDLYVDQQATCQDVVYGATSIASGKTCVGIKDGLLTVTASVQQGWTLNQVHVLVGTSKSTLAIPGQFPYGTHKGSCTISGLQATCSIPIQDAWRVCGRSLFIVVHVDATNPAGSGQTGWGRGACYDTKGNCAKYFTFTTSCRCPVIYQYEPIVTTSTYVTTITTSKVYTVTFPDLSTADSCNDPRAPTSTSVVTTTTTLPASWTPPPE